jgi:hypothetical protein
VKAIDLHHAWTQFAPQHWSANPTPEEQQPYLKHHGATVLGHSFEGKPIHVIHWGRGSIRIAAWARMHGNEPTATKAVYDFLGWLNNTPEGLQLAERVTWMIIPELNPDGAEDFTRRNAQGLDINRDFKAFQTPEAQLLRDALLQFKPHLALNLHDQRSRYGAGNSGKPATLAFLAPAQSHARAITPRREWAMGCVSQWLGEIQTLFPDLGIARFSDEFYPTAVGEWSTIHLAPTILIEAGHCVGDRQRNLARELTFMCLVWASTCDPNHQDLAQAYLDLPVNAENFFDIRLQQVPVVLPGRKPFAVDLGFRYASTDAITPPALVLEEVGDLAHQFAHLDFPVPPDFTLTSNPFAMVGQSHVFPGNAADLYPRF